MKLKKLLIRTLAAASTAGATLLLASCGASNTVDFLYVTSNTQNPGQINVYQADSESGAILQLADSPYPSGGRNPVYDIASPDGETLYVVNHDDNTIVTFAIGTDGKLYPLQTTTTPGTEPVALAINSSGTALYVLDYYAPASPGQPSYTDLNPGPGAVIVYPLIINPTNGIGTLGTPLDINGANYAPVQCFPANLAVTPDGDHLYVTNTNSVVVTDAPPVTGTVPQLPQGCPSSGTISEFNVNSTSSSGGVQNVTGITPVAAPLSTGSGSAPTGIVADPGNSSIYVTDSALNQVYSYAVQANGGLSLTATAPTGTMPMAATVSGTAGAPGKFLYISNYADGSIGSYALNGGIPTPVSTASAGTSGPLCLAIEPQLGRFLYSADYIGGKVGGAQLDPTTGELHLNMGSPYLGSGQPTCLAAIGHAGNPNGL